MSEYPARPACSLYWQTFGCIPLQQLSTHYLESINLRDSLFQKPYCFSLHSKHLEAHDMARKDTQIFPPKSDRIPKFPTLADGSLAQAENLLSHPWLTHLSPCHQLPPVPLPIQSITKSCLVYIQDVPGKNSLFSISTATILTHLTVICHLDVCNKLLTSPFTLVLFHLELLKFTVLMSMDWDMIKCTYFSCLIW